MVRNFFYFGLPETVKLKLGTTANKNGFAKLHQMVCIKRLPAKFEITTYIKVRVEEIVFLKMSYKFLKFLKAAQS